MRHGINVPRFALGVLVLAVAGCLPARASMIITVGSANVFQGGASALDVTLTNTGPGAQNIAGFTLEISVPGASGITFIGVTESTMLTYVFFGDSFDALTLGDSTISDGTAHPGPGAIIDASDFSNSGAGINMAGSSTLGLGHVQFSASGSASLGLVAVTLITTGCPSACGPTSLSDSGGASVAFTGVNGTITVQPASAVPEPSTLVLLLLSLPMLATAKWPWHLRTVKAGREYFAKPVLRKG